MAHKSHPKVGPNHSTTPTQSSRTGCIFTDLYTISLEEWAEMGVLAGISKALKRDMKKYKRSLHDAESGSNNDS